MSPAAQAKLLRILVDGQLTRVGSTKPRTVDVRVLVATHRNLQERVNEGLFREDLYYRLAVFPIHIPPLRERPQDIPGLCELFCRQIASDMKLPARPMPSAVAENLKHYAFPGNARELRNLIERAYILSRGGSLEGDHFPSPTALPAAAGAVPRNALARDPRSDRIPRAHGEGRHPARPRSGRRRAGRSGPAPGTLAQRSCLQADQVRNPDDGLAKGSGSFSGLFSWACSSMMEDTFRRVPAP